MGWRGDYVRFVKVVILLAHAQPHARDRQPRCLGPSAPPLMIAYPALILPFAWNAGATCG
jgi:hypothetical protein